MTREPVIESFASLYGLDAAMELCSRHAALDCPLGSVAVVSFCDAATPRFDARIVSRAEAIAIAPFAACSLAIEPCDDVRHVIEIRCAGVDHSAIGSLRSMPVKAPS